MCPVKPDDCVAGTMLDPPSGRCMPIPLSSLCPAGSWRSAAVVECVPCAVGKWGVLSGKTSEAAACTGVCPASSPGTGSGKSSEADACVRSGWYRTFGAERSCDSFCASKKFAHGASQGACRVERLRAVTTAAGFNVANAALRAESRPSFDCVSNPISSNSKYSPMGGKDRKCYYNTKGSGSTGAATCAATSSHSRLCCCTRDSEDPATLCPVSASDCDAATEWDAPSGRCMPRVESTTSTTALVVMGCASQHALNATSDCDRRGGGVLTVFARGFGCTTSTPFPTITLRTSGGSALACSNVRAPPIVPNAKCALNQFPPGQALSCTLPFVPLALVGVDFGVFVEWQSNTTVSLRGATGAVQSNVSVLPTTNAKSEVSVTFGCFDENCTAHRRPTVAWVEGCRGDHRNGQSSSGVKDPTESSPSLFYRARACPREGGTRVTVHGLRLLNANVTVGGQPCRDIVHDTARPDTALTCTLGCPKGSRDEWIADELKRARVAIENVAVSGYFANTQVSTRRDGVFYGEWIDSQIDGNPGWVAPSTTGYDSILFDLIYPQLIAGVVTQGRADKDNWITGMKVYVSNSNEAASFKLVQEWAQSTTSSGVNTDRSTHVNSIFTSPALGRYVKIVPSTWKSYPAMRADVLFGSKSGGYLGSADLHYVVACNSQGCSETGEKNRLTVDANYDPATPHMCDSPPEIDSVIRTNSTITLLGRGFGAGAPSASDGKTKLRVRFGDAIDATCDLSKPGRIVAWRQTRLEISLADLLASSPCIAMLTAARAGTSLHSGELTIQLQLGGAASCYPPEIACISAVSGCEANKSETAHSVNSEQCRVEGGVAIVVRGANLNETFVAIANDALVALQTAGLTPGAALEVTHFVRGSPPSARHSRSYDEVHARLPCLHPVELWGGTFGLVSQTSDGARSLPTLTFLDDYDVGVDYLCYKAPVVTSITPAAALQGGVVKIRGSNFAALCPTRSVNTAGRISGDVVLGPNAPCVAALRAATWSFTEVELLVCNGIGHNLQTVVQIGSMNSSKDIETSPRFDFIDVSAEDDQPILVEAIVLHEGAIFLKWKAPGSSFNPINFKRPWVPINYKIEFFAVAPGDQANKALALLAGRCGESTSARTVLASNATVHGQLPRVSTTILDSSFVLGASVALRISATKDDLGIMKSLCAPALIMDIVLPPSPPTNVTITLGHLDAISERASFLVAFRTVTSRLLHGAMRSKCNYIITFALSDNATSAIQEKVVPATEGPSQIELLTKMQPNANYDISVSTACGVFPPQAGENGILRGQSSERAYFLVEPHREYASICARTGDFSSLVDPTCIACPAEAEGGKCVLGLLGIRKQFWMPPVSLERAIETRNAKKQLMWSCRTLKACGTIAATLDYGPGPRAVPVSTCGIGHTGNVCLACKEAYGPIGDGCFVCPSTFVSFLLSCAMLLWLLVNIGWQTYNTYTDAQQRARGVGVSGTASVIKTFLDFCQLVSALSFIKVEPPEAVRRLFSSFALGNGVSANALPVKCLLNWDVFERNGFYIVIAVSAMLLPSIIAALYWTYRYVRSKRNDWKVRFAAWCAGRNVEEPTGDAIPAPEEDNASDEDASAADAAPVMEASEAPRRRRSSIVGTALVSLTETIAHSELKQQTVLGPSELKQQKAFCEADSDNDGRVTRAEFATLAAGSVPVDMFCKLQDEDATIDLKTFMLIKRVQLLRTTVVIVVTSTVVGECAAYNCCHPHPFLPFPPLTSQMFSARLCPPI